MTTREVDEKKFKAIHDTVLSSILDRFALKLEIMARLEGFRDAGAEDDGAGLLPAEFVEEDAEEKGAGVIAGSTVVTVVVIGRRYGARAAREGRN